ncbi:hypothetical protein ABHZ18_18095, partial [Bacteroides uniformis]|uniref:hypothetical protein n=1 Tax=Bacteroides uniformis TaxID=820 RepID=UPI00233048C6
MKYYHFNGSIYLSGATSNRKWFDMALSFSKLYLCYDVNPLNKVFTALHRLTSTCILGTISEYKDNYFILLMTYSCKESDSSAYWANIDIALLSPIFKFTFFFFKQEGFPPFSSSMILCKKTTKQCISYFLHIPADTRSAFPVISVQSPVSIQCCW